MGPRRYGRRRIGRWAAALAAGAVVAGPGSASAASGDQSFDTRLGRALRRSGSKARKAAADIAEGQIRSAVPSALIGEDPWLRPSLGTALGDEAVNPESPLRQTLDKLYRPSPPGEEGAGAGLLPPTAALLSWDGFRRSDRLLAGDVAPSGQSYRVGGEPNSLTIERNRQISHAVPRRADIGYVDLQFQPRTIAAEFVWRSASTHSQNVVIGTCGVGFGSGSIQLAVFYRHYEPLQVDWLLFCVTAPMSEPYATLASGRFAPGFSFVGDGETSYRLVLHRTSPASVLIQLPDDQLVTATDDRIQQYWGRSMGWQLRRPYDTDGYAEFTAIAASG